MKLGKMLVAAASAAPIIAMSHTAASASVGTLSQYASAVSLLPADHRTGSGAIITRVNAHRATNRHDPTLSTFLVDYPPGASAVLHRMPSSGYVLVYVPVGDNQCFCVARRPRHLPRRRDVGRAGICV